MTNHIEPLIGFSTAGLSTATLWLAQAAPASVEPILQAGGTVGLIAGLSVALIAVWKDRAELAKKLGESESSRIVDAKDALKEWKLEAERGDRSRRELLIEMKNQTSVIKGEK